MNSTTSHEMRNPLNSILSNIDTQEQCSLQLKTLIQRNQLSKTDAEEASEIFENYKKSLTISKSSS